ncbi:MULTISPECIES: helix-turn-helix domain-containing protein [unclassified Streptomyces]|uniref:helix-turn-helix domain-containing protein n=1 Tax=unclassified Streptomyces TaxID=2593676 RepID=UPI003802EDC3
MDQQPSVDAVIEQIAPRLRRAREKKGVTLARLARATGISTSTLSRLESGVRRPSLELVLPITAALGIPLGDVVAAPRTQPPLPSAPVRGEGRLLIPLARRGSGPRAEKMVIPVHHGRPRLRTHEGHAWVYVLTGRLRVRLGERDFTMSPGEAAEFDCRVPHWFGAAGSGGAEALSLFGSRGERIRLRTPPS